MGDFKNNKPKQLNAMELVAWLDEQYNETAQDNFRQAANCIRHHTKCSLGGTDFVISGSEESLKYVLGRLAKAV